MRDREVVRVVLCLLCVITMVSTGLVIWLMYLYTSQHIPIPVGLLGTLRDEFLGSVASTVGLALMRSTEGA